MELWGSAGTSFRFAASELNGLDGTTPVADIVGVRVLVGTFRQRLSAGLELSFADAAGAAISRCHAPSKLLIDNDWTDFFLSCEALPGRPQGNPQMIDLRFEGLSAAGVVFYRVKEAAEHPALVFFRSRYAGDQPPLGYQTALNYGQLWPQWQFVTLRTLGEVAWALLIAMAASLVRDVWRLWRRRKVPEYGNAFHARWPLVLGGAWLLALGTFVTNYPPLETPDEPQHLNGLLMSLPEAQRVIAKDEIRRLADRTTFRVSAETRTTPVLVPDASLPKGLGASDFAALPQDRSRVYQWLADRLVPIAYSAFEHRLIGSEDLNLYLRLAMLAPSVTLVLLAFGVQLALRRWGSASFLMLCLLNPVALTVLLTPSNYSWAVATGGICASLLLPDRRSRYPFAALYMLLAVLPIFADATKSTPFFLFALPLCAIACARYLVDEAKPRSWVLYAACPFIAAGALAVGASMVGDKFGRVAELWQGLCERFGAGRCISPFAEGARVAVGIESGVLLFFAAILAIPAVWRRTRKVREVNGTTSPAISGLRTRWALTFLVLFGTVVGIVGLSWHYPDPVLMPNIFHLTELRPPLATFLRTGWEALASQTIHWTQDYYLWQTYFVTFGWMDTQAPMGLYFSIRQAFNILVLGGVLALIWRTRAFLLTAAPSALMFSVFFALLLVGGWYESHTALGRYGLPGWGFAVLPSVLGVGLLVEPSAPEESTSILIVGMALFNAVLCIYSIYHLLPWRFVIGG